MLSKVKVRTKTQPNITKLVGLGFGDAHRKRRSGGKIFPQTQPWFIKVGNFGCFSVVHNLS
jgi:hypothetical protein